MAAESSEDLSDTIADVAARPKAATGDNGSVQEHSLKELIEADQHIANRNAGRGFTMSRFKPGGA